MKPNEEISNSNRNYLTLKEFSDEVIFRCEYYNYPNWRKIATAKFLNKLYRRGYTISDTISKIILN